MMIDQMTFAALATAQADIRRARQGCDAALNALGQDAGSVPAPAAPFLSACAEELEVMAGIMRLAAERAAPLSASAR